MKKIPIFILIFSFIYGCSIPMMTTHSQLYSMTKEEKKIKKGMGKRKVVLVRDFRGNELYEEDFTGLKDEVEKYISGNPDLSEEIKNNLRNLKVIEGENKKEVELLMGRPDKISRLSSQARYDATEAWIYKINKIRAFTVFILPIAFVHEGYYLYFKENKLAGIERHYLEQMVKQGSAPGVAVGGKKEEAKK